MDGKNYAKSKDSLWGPESVVSFGHRSLTRCCERETWNEEDSTDDTAREQMATLAGIIFWLNILNYNKQL